MDYLRFLPMLLLNLQLFIIVHDFVIYHQFQPEKKLAYCSGVFHQMSPLISKNNSSRYFSLQIGLASTKL